MKKRDGRIPAAHIEDENLPGAYWKALHDLWYDGYDLRTQYDRTDSDTGKFIDPPGKDIRLSMVIDDPFAQPRYPILCFMNRGELIAEYFGTKNHLVIPYDELLGRIKEEKEFGDPETTFEWPYHYAARLMEFPGPEGTKINQLELAVDRLAEDWLTRRAIATTRLPPVDAYINEDQPCLGELHFRAIEDETDDKDPRKRRLRLGMHINYRSWDAGKAFGDNLIALTMIQQKVAVDLQDKTQREVVCGQVYCVGNSFHLYGQDIAEASGGKFEGEGFFEKFPTRESFVKRAWTSEMALDIEIIPNLEDLEKKKDNLRLSDESMSIIQKLKADLKSGRLIA
jgi:hypothetical protein